MDKKSTNTSNINTKLGEYLKNKYGQETTAKPRNKPPSRQKRDKERAEKYRNKLMQSTTTTTVAKQMESMNLGTTSTVGTMTDRREAAPSCQPDPAIIYRDIEISARLSRLEEAPTLTLALRHLVRTCHPRGSTVTFPVPEAVDRIQLRCHNLPTNPDELQPLVEKVFSRRDEPLDLDELYKQFVMTHGHTAFDHTQKWPVSHVHTRHP